MVTLAPETSDIRIRWAAFCAIFFFPNITVGQTNPLLHAALGLECRGKEIGRVSNFSLELELYLELIIEYHCATSPFVQLNMCGPSHLELECREKHRKFKEARSLLKSWAVIHGESVQNRQNNLRSIDTVLRAMNR